MHMRRKGFSVHKVTLAEGMSEAEYLLSVQYCARCGTEYDTHQAAITLIEDEELGEDDDAQPLAVCRNRMACDGNLIEQAIETLDSVRWSMLEGESPTRRHYNMLSAAWKALHDVYGDGLLALDDEQRCAECLVPIGRDAEPGALCRFCKEQADDEAVP
jgi:hypothetical protein